MQKIRLTVNGVTRQMIADPDMALIDLLREDLRLTGTKEGCNRNGQCGACTVIVNGRAVRSCTMKVGRLDGANVITVEGLGTPQNPHLIQEAFVLSGAIQCGYCTPGMIMAAKDILDRNPNPSTADIKRGMRRNLCRCTGYVKIIDAVKLAGRFIRGEITPEKVRPDPNGPKIGVSHPRPYAMIKACGVAQFSADILVPGAAEVAVVRSPHMHAAIKSIDFSAAERMPGVVGVMTAKDIKGTNRLPSGGVPDRPVICEDRVRSVGDPVAVVVAETRQQARDAASKVVVEYELLPVFRSPQEALAEDAPQLHAQWPNLCHTQRVIKGDAEKALASSAHVIERRFKTQLNHQAPLEPEASVAFLEGEGEDAKLVIIGRSINIHAHLAVIQQALGWENASYEEAFSGGNFGIKAEITSEAIAAAAVLHFKRPIRYIPNLTESLEMTPKRHPFDMSIKIGADAEGKLTAFHYEYLVDNGAYTSIGKGIVGRAMSMASSAYHIPDFFGLGKLVYTNNNYGSAARGAGPPQTLFALECAMEMLAEKIGIDSLEFRVRNSLLPGQTRNMGPAVEQWPFPEVCAAIKPHYERARRDAEAGSAGKIRRGFALAAGAFGIGGAGDSSTVAVELDPDDGITIYGAIADPGEGNDSMLTQLAADELQIPMSKVRLQTRSTDNTTATGPAAGSRITYMIGSALLDAIAKLKQAMDESAACNYNDLKGSGKPTRYVGTRRHTDTQRPDPETGQGPNFHSVVQSIQLAEVEVNTETGEVKVLKVTTAVDSGTVINPKNLEGQVEGGVDQGIGYALREQFIPGETKDWLSFKFPTIEMACEQEIIVNETPRTDAPKGATGIGEMTMVTTAPAIVSAIHNACGIWIYDLPATPDKIKAALAERK